MFFYTGYSLTSLAMFLLCLVVLLALNEVTRRSKWLAIAVYVALPIICTLVVWPRTTAGDGNAGGTWFSWVKTYSALAGVIIFMGIRYSKRLGKNKVMLCLPMAILAVNILEAVFADLECFPKQGVVEAGLLMNGGPWNIINAIAGILLIITLSGWFGIMVSNKKSKDMIWADQLWFWIIAYGLWNWSYCYNCISNRSFYAGFLLLIASGVAEFLFRKGAWLQHRAQTLALWAMFSLTVDYAASTNLFSITSTQAAAPKLVLSIAALAANVAVLVFEIRTIRRTHRNPLKEPIYTDLASYQTILADNDLK